LGRLRGSVIAVGAVISTELAFHGVNSELSVVIGVLAGCACGLINAVLVIYGGVNSFIVTLGTLSAFEGLTLLLTGGLPLNVPAGTGGLSNSTKVGPVPMPILIVLLLAVLAAFVLSRTVLGRHVFGVGDNPEAARLVGVNVRRTKFAMFVLAGGLAAFAGIVQAASLQSAEAGSGEADVLPIIAAVVIGGVSLYGGRGTITGVLLGAVLLGEIENAYVTLHLSSFLQEATFGAVIVLAGLADQLRQGRYTARVERLRRLRGRRRPPQRGTPEAPPLLLGGAAAADVPAVDSSSGPSW
jgi:ribose transport system permease protein